MFYATEIYAGPGANPIELRLKIYFHSYMLRCFNLDLNKIQYDHNKRIVTSKNFRHILLFLLLKFIFINL